MRKMVAAALLLAVVSSVPADPWQSMTAVDPNTPHHSGHVRLNGSVASPESEACMVEVRRCIAACDSAYQLGTPAHAGCRFNCHAEVCREK